MHCIVLPLDYYRALYVTKTSTLGCEIIPAINQ